MIVRLFLLLCLCLALPMQSLAKAARLDTVEEILFFWSPEQHLYVCGELPVKPEALDELESWLDELGRTGR